MNKNITQKEACEILMSNFKQTIQRKSDLTTPAQMLFFEKLQHYLSQKISGIESQDTFFGTAIDKIFENRLYRKQKNFKMLMMHEIVVEVNDSKRCGYTFKINELHERQDLNFWMAKMENQLEMIQKTLDKAKKRKVINDYKRDERMKQTQCSCRSKVENK